MRHSLDVADLGPSWAHPFKPSCACGWTGVQVRHRKGATRQYRQHMGSVVRLAKKARGYRAQPRPLTPAERLPLDLLPQSVSFT